jgi:5S rRNA maturation endonuclease (ribonuclease M5)
MSNVTAFERLVDVLRDHGSTVTDTGHHKAQAQCPAHDDGRASLSVTGIAGQVLVYCHAGCDTGDVLAALKLASRDLFDNPRGAEYQFPDGRIVRRTPDKRFWQDGNTKGTSLFHVDRIGDAPIVYVVEGEKDVLALESAGVAATCSAMGAGKADKFDWTPLRGKTVIIVADKDEPGRKHASQVAELLGGTAVSVRIVEAAIGKDAADHVAGGKAPDEFVPAPTVGQKPVVDDDDTGEAPPRKSQATRLVEMARSEYQLGSTDTDEPYATHPDRPHLAMMLRGGRTGLRAELARRYFDENDSAATQSALADACTVLEGYAADAEPRRVDLRVAEHAGSAYIDMGDAAGRVIRIAEGRWYVEPSAPVLFRRTKLTGQLVEPVTGGDLAALWEFVPIAVEDRPLLLALMVQALIQPDTPHPVLLLAAEQGSAKSTVTRSVVDLLDPSPVPLRKAPRDADGWVTAANASWVVALDNLSGVVPAWLSDSLCRASTGDGDVRRALYSDGDVSVFSFRRVVIGNGIDVTVTAGDLAERLLRIELPRIEQRRADDDIAEAWQSARPDIMGGLLDLAARVHQRLRGLRVDDLPRMADYARVLAAVDAEMGADGMDRYRGKVQQAAADTLDAPLIAKLVTDRHGFDAKTSAEILDALTPALNPDGSAWRPPKGWPSGPRAVTNQLTRNAPAMRAQGWYVEHDDGKNHRNATQWNIKPPPTDEEGRKTGSHGSRNSSVQVDGENGRESSASQQSGASQADSRPRVNGQGASQGGFADSRHTEALTCTDEPASHASQEYGLSLVAEDADPSCRYCGGELRLPSQQRRGFCGRGACITANREAS